jgi:hypothetical protein
VVDASAREEESIRQEESIPAELRRIDFTGTFWFGAGLIAAAIIVGGLLSTGWRPADLPAGPAEVLWWVGAAMAGLGLAGLAWAGCPVLAFDLETADRQKAFTIRAGVLVYAIGGTLSIVMVLISPAPG